MNPAPTSDTFRYYNANCRKHSKRESKFCIYLQILILWMKTLCSLINQTYCLVQSTEVQESQILRAIIPLKSAFDVVNDYADGTNHETEDEKQ